MKKNKQKTINSFEELAGAISFGSIGDKVYANSELKNYFIPIDSEYYSRFKSELVDELEEHNKKVKQRIKNYDRL